MKSEEAREAEQAQAGSAGEGAQAAESSGQTPEGGAQVPGGSAQAHDAGDPAVSEASAPAESAEELTDPLSEAMNTIASLEDQLARRNADVYNVEQQYNAYVRRSKAELISRQEMGVAKVAEALLPVLDDVELARQHGDLTGPFGAIADKLEQALAGFGVERFGAVGDEFDPQVHEALMHSTSAEVEAEQVGTLIQPGYRLGEKVLRAARVGVVSPE